jgi:hypothetical protein
MPNYQATIAEFEDELARLTVQREQLESRMAALTQAIESIKVLAQESDEPLVVPPDLDDGFTDRVRAIAKANYPRPITAVEVRDVLMESSPHDDPKTVLIHVHNTLKRLHRQKELSAFNGAAGRTAYTYDMNMAREILAQLANIPPVVPPDLK